MSDMVIFWNFNNGNAIGFKSSSKSVEYLKSEDVKKFIEKSTKNVVYVAKGLSISDIDARDFQEHLSVNPGQPPEHAVFERLDAPEKGQKLGRMRVLGSGDAIDGDRFSYFCVSKIIGQVDSKITQKAFKSIITEIKNNPVKYHRGKVIETKSWPELHALTQSLVETNAKFKVDGLTVEVIEEGKKKIKKNEQPPMKTAKAIQAYLGFKKFQDNLETKVFVNSEYDLLQVIEEIDVWAATGDKEGQRYRMTYLELTQDQLDDVKAQSDMKPAMQQAGISEKKWLTLPYEERAIHALQYGIWNENYGEYDTVFDAWKGVRDRMHPTMNFNE